MIEGVAKGRVLLVSDSRRSAALRVLRRSGFEVVMTYTADHAVAVCASRDFAAVVLDQGLFLEVDGWSVAQSIKLVRPRQRVVLIARAKPLDGDPPVPKGVDNVVSSDELRELSRVIEAT